MAKVVFRALVARQNTKVFCVANHKIAYTERGKLWHQEIKVGLDINALGFFGPVERYTQTLMLKTGCAFFERLDVVFVYAC